MKRFIMLFAMVAIPCMAFAPTPSSSGAGGGPDLYTPAQIRETFGVDVSDGNHAPVVRAILQWMNRAAGDESYSADIVVESLKEMAMRLPEPARGVVNFIVADFYRTYWQSNRWQLRDRTSAPDAGGTLDTWDIGRLFAAAVGYYELAMYDARALQSTSIREYDEVMSYQYRNVPGYYLAAIDKVGHEYVARFYPTLYDFLISGAIEAFAGEMGSALPGRQFAVDDPRWFAPAAEFVGTDVAAPESPSAEYEVLSMYRKLLSFRLAEFERDRSSANLLPLVAADVERLKYVRQTGVYDDVDALYESALRRIADEYAGYPESAYALYGLASLCVDQAGSWSRDGDQSLRYKYVEAYSLCDTVVERWPEFADYARALQELITAPSLNISVEERPYPGDPFLTLASCRNVEELYIRAYKLTDGSEVRRVSNGDDLTWLGNRLPSLEMPAVVMPDYGDHQTHSAQFAIPALPQGHYLLLASHKPFGEDWQKNDDLIAETVVQVTPLTTVVRNGGGATFGLKGDNYVKQVYVTDAKSGKPIANAAVDAWMFDYDKPRDAAGNYPQIKFGSYRTGSNGVAYITGGNGSRNRLSRIVITDRGGARLVEDDYSSLYFSYYGSQEEDDEPTALFFTDRAIYRPGQTVYYKILLMAPDGHGGKKLVTGRGMDVTLYDVNHKEAAEQRVTTNDFGSASGSFTIPQGLLNGTMTIETDYGEAYISVEEYKRPTFEVEIDPTEKSYRYGDRIELTGAAKALAGYSVDNSTVRYRVTRESSLRFLYDFRMIAPREIATGEVRTDAAGKFTIPFEATADGVRDRNMVSDFVVTVDVTDANGETRSATGRIAVSDRPLVVQAAVPSQVDDRKNLRFGMATTNLNGKPVAAEVRVTVDALSGPERILRERLWERPDTTLMARREFERLFPHDVYAAEDDPATYTAKERVASFTVATRAGADSTKLDLGSLADRPAGWYRVTLKAEGEGGVSAGETYTLRLNGTPSGRQTPIVRVDDWAVALKSSGMPGEKAEFLIAAPEQGTPVRCDVFRDGRLSESRTIKAGPTPQRVEIPIGANDRGGFSVQFIMVSGGRVYDFTQTVSVPYNDRVLDVEFTTFRSQLLPGEHERWTLTVKNDAGQAAAAEMVATLYDASLDEFAQLRWPSLRDLMPWRNNSVPNIGRRDLVGRTGYQGRVSSVVFARPAIELERFGGGYTRLMRNDGKGNDLSVLAEINGIVAPAYSMRAPEPQPDLEGGVVVIGYQDKRVERFTGAAMTVMANDVNVETEMVFADFDEELSFNSNPTSDMEIAGSGASLLQVATRQNFAETAFFYPHLRTNERGEIVVEFTVPESLTRWNMFGFAHTKDLKAGAVRNSLITQKQVAVSANSPRFLREGDTIEFTAKVNNITREALTGEALLRLFDAATMQPIEGVITSRATLPFTAAAGQSSGLSWTLRIPEGVSAITYRLTAQAGAHTDGEERTVPVMSNTILVTESMPFMVRAGQSTTFDFARLREGAATVERNKSLTLEFTSNPAWYAVQAMPYLMEYPYDCAEQVFSKFYANSLSAAIVNSTPRIKAIFEQWRDTPDSKNALLSNLEKNQELKQVLLEETPWVVQAENEAERKKRLGLLFDLNQMAAGQRTAFEKLRKMQRGDGGFAWFDGLEPNRYITQHIVAGFSQLSALKAIGKEYAPQVQQIVGKGFDYLDSDLLRDYEAAKKSKGFDPARQYISYTQLHYLYAASFSGHRPEDAARREAFDFWHAQAMKYWDQFNVYGQGLAALAFHRYGDRETAAKVVAALRKASSTTDDMGMFWRSNRAGYFWHEAPIETQALMISVFDEVAADASAVNELKIWLLRNKQTNDWQTTKATADACYALLRTGGNLLDESRVLEVSVGGRPLAEAAGGEIRPEAGTGYMKTSWAGSDVTPSMSRLDVTNPNRAGIAWGALYWQYFEQADKVTGTETQLRMDKQIFVKRNTPRGPELTEIKDGAAVEVGDLLTVRLVLRAHRDYEYVHLKDMRAAGLEPVRTVSGYRYQDGLSYYENVKDASTNFFITVLRGGTYVFEYDLRVTHAGDFSNGITTFQCMYAPEFSAHSKGMRIRAKQ